MGCTNLVLDSSDKICLTYKAGQPDFLAFLRKYDHGFREIIDPENREGVSAVNVPNREVFIISDDDYLSIHDRRTYDRLFIHNIELKPSDTDDKVEIITIQLSKDEKFLAVLSGKNVIKEIEELHQLHVF